MVASGFVLAAKHTDDASPQIRGVDAIEASATVPLLKSMVHGKNYSVAKVANTKFIGRLIAKLSEYLKCFRTRWKVQYTYICLYKVCINLNLYKNFTNLSNI